MQSVHGTQGEQSDRSMVSQSKQASVIVVSGVPVTTQVPLEGVAQSRFHDATRPPEKQQILTLNVLPHPINSIASQHRGEIRVKFSVTSMPSEQSPKSTVKSSVPM